MPLCNILNYPRIHLNYLLAILYSSLTIFSTFLTHMVIGVCSVAKLMASLDSPPKTMALPIYTKIVAIAQTTMPYPHPRLG